MTNLSTDAKLAAVKMETNPSFGCFHTQMRRSHLQYDVSDRGAFVRDFAGYFYAGAPARVESPRQPNADG